MNLYQIMLEHYAPKDSEKGIFTYLAAESDDQVFEWLKNDPKLKDGRHLFTGYDMVEDDEESYEIYDEDYNEIGTETAKERLIRLKGDLNDPDVELSDLYYGRTLIGWNVVKFNITELEIINLEGLGIAIENFQ